METTDENQPETELSEADELMLKGGLGAILAVDNDIIGSMVTTSWVYFMGVAGIDHDLTVGELRNFCKMFLEDFRRDAKAHGVANA